MTKLIYSMMAAALLAAIATIGFTPAQATITAPETLCRFVCNTSALSESVSLSLEGYRRQ